MSLPTPLVHTEQEYNIDQWRIRTNDTIDRVNNTVTEVGDLANLAGGETTVVDGVNGARSFAIAVSIALG
jgi:hypothetical protein